MQSPYNSYSSMSLSSQRMDMAPTTQYSSARTATCAFPSWPQRGSLIHGAADPEERASSYLSDDDLFPQDLCLEDDARSISSGSSASNVSLSPPHVTDQQLELQQRQQRMDEKLAMQREALRYLHAEKERRTRQAQLKRQHQQQRRPSSNKKIAKSHLDTTMTPINEAVVE